MGEVGAVYRTAELSYAARLMSARIDAAAHTNNNAPSMVVTAADSSK
jgi:hypothetical protein